jgi:hypothetical protein
MAGVAAKTSQPFVGVVEIVAAFWMFSVLELMIWLPRARNLDWWLYVGIGIYIVRFFVRRKAPANPNRA